MPARPLAGPLTRPNLRRRGAGVVVIPCLGKSSAGCVTGKATETVADRQAGIQYRTQPVVRLTNAWVDFAGRL